MENKVNARLTGKQTRILKLILDACMITLLALMYKLRVVSIAFHEIGGLTLLGLFLIHLLLSARWIRACTRRCFVKGTAGMVRARYIVGSLLLLAFLTVGVTGALISRVVFSIHIAGRFQTLHYFASAVAIILLGVHLGLHVEFIFGRLVRKGANKAARAVLAIVVAGMVAFGGYSLSTSSFLSYLTAPMQAARIAHGSFEPVGDAALDGSGELPVDLSLLSEDSGNGGHGQWQGGGKGRGEGRGASGQTDAALLIAQYVSITALFAAITYGLLRLFGKKRPRVQKAPLAAAIESATEPQKPTEPQE
ncbi:MAG: DUF4405 domain-containing protein [Eubacteriales bacterium]